MLTSYAAVKISEKLDICISQYSFCLIYPTRGRFGNVYRCEEKKTGRSFAAKFIKVKSSERDETRQEVAIMNQLHHPKLLLLWDAFEAPREMVLVMEQ